MDSITEEQRALLTKTAFSARKQAYAVYSKYHVGAALLAADGIMYSGCNVENASFGLSVCAERVAVFDAVTAGQRHFAALAVATAGGNTPCGACRQVLSEFCMDLPIILLDVDNLETHRQTSLAELLPDQFRL